MDSHGPVHDLVLRQRLRLVVQICAAARALALDDRELHVFDLDPHKQEVNLADDNVLEVVPARQRQGRGHTTGLSLRTLQYRGGAGTGNACACECVCGLQHDTLSDVLRLVVLKLDVQAVLDANLHLDRGVDLGRLVTKMEGSFFAFSVRGVSGRHTTVVTLTPPGWIFATGRIFRRRPRSKTEPHNSYSYRYRIKYILFKKIILHSCI